MMTLLIPVIMVLMFVATLGGASILLGHYRMQILKRIARDEAEFTSTLESLYLHDWNAKALVRLRFMVAPVAGLVVFLVAQRWIFAVLVVLILHVAPRFLLDVATKRRRERLEAQVVDLINSLVATTKSGMNLHQSLIEIADRLPPPIAQECRVILRRIEAGQTMEAALCELDRRVAIPNLGLVIQSLLVNERRGGKLPDLLERIARSLREIERVEERVKTETSGIRLSSRMMAGMPFVVCFLLYTASPEHVLMLFETTLGNLLLMVALIFDYAGFAMIRKLSELDI